MGLAGDQKWAFDALILVARPRTFAAVGGPTITAF
jgi:hypothetical protein